MKWIKEHKKVCIIIAIVVVVVIAIIIGVVSGGKKQMDSNEETATVEKRTLMESVSATGTFVAADEEKITSDTTGVEVLAVNVEVGDRVSAGDVIAVLDSADLQDNLADAKESLADTNEQTQRTKDSAKRNLEQAGKTRDEDLADVDTNIQDAYDEWQSAESPPTIVWSLSVRIRSSGSTTPIRIRWILTTIPWILPRIPARPSRNVLMTYRSRLTEL